MDRNIWQKHDDVIGQTWLVMSVTLLRLKHFGAFLQMEMKREFSSGFSLQAAVIFILPRKQIITLSTFISSGLIKVMKSWAIASLFKNVPLKRLANRKWVVVGGDNEEVRKEARRRLEVMISHSPNDVLTVLKSSLWLADQVNTSWSPPGGRMNSADRATKISN